MNTAKDSRTSRAPLSQTNFPNLSQTDFPTFSPSDFTEKKDRLLFASDFDNTFSLYPNGVGKETLDAVEKFRKDGNIFGIVTGREYVMTLPIIENYGRYFDFVICMTGAYAASGAGEPIFDFRAEAARLFDILKMLHREGPVYLDVSERAKTVSLDVTRPLSGELESVQKVKRLKYFSQINTKYDTVEKSERICRALTELYGDTVNPHMNGSCIDIPPAGVSKAVSVLKAAERFGVSRENIFAAGDNNNDVPMLEEFHGYTLPHGTDGAKSAAERIFPCVADMLRDAEERAARAPLDLK